MRSLTTRSVVLSLLLGTHPPELPVAALVRVAAVFGVRETALRAALSRMVAAGDLDRTARGYRLAERLRRRQQRQDDALAPRTRAWDGGWEIVVVTAVGRGAADRAALRARLTALRLAELREGVWLRPDQLVRELPDLPARRFVSRPDDDPVALARSLWDLDGRAATGRDLLRAQQGAGDPAERFTVAAAVVRHLLADPVLPPALLPPDWPVPALRAAYAAYRAEVEDLVRPVAEVALRHPTAGPRMR
ncbi:MAG: PaaX domain-containing protein, C- domain protein [Pseudonocardiales bacterium]|nr:PaaX domain-containing protein, C- domain protein [Pseudonocardiales bacterium]